MHPRDVEKLSQHIPLTPGQRTVITGNSEPRYADRGQGQLRRVILLEELLLKAITELEEGT